MYVPLLILLKKSQFPILGCCIPVPKWKTKRWNRSQWAETCILQEKKNNNYLLKVCSIKEKKKNLHISVCCSASSYSKLSKTTSPKVLAKMVNKLLCLETLKICMIISKFCQNVTESENFQLKCKHQAAHCVTQKSIQKECFWNFVDDFLLFHQVVPPKDWCLTNLHLLGIKNVGKIIQKMTKFQKTTNENMFELLMLYLCM